MKKILIIDDEQNFRMIISKVIQDENYKVFSAGTGEDGITNFLKNKPDLVLLDLQLPDITGIEVLKKIKELNPLTEVLMLTAYGNINSAVEAMKLGAFDYLSKPIDNDELILKISTAINSTLMKKEIHSLQQKLNGKKVVKESMGQSKEIQKVVELAEIVCHTNMTVILEGKSGTGKELFARMIHQNSPRKEKPFVAVDCGAIPETLFESEMFGYEKGAFTGAVSSKKGRFEHANGGTLFLDEISNLPIVSQSKFLRAIQEKKIQRLGSKKEVSIDIRIIVASNHLLEESVEKGEFRVDLFHRLNEFKIELPTLIQRKDDIPVLVAYFIAEANKELGKSVESLSAQSYEILMAYNWPGNIRELKNVINRAVLMANSGEIQNRHLMISGKIPQLNESMNLKEVRNTAEKDVVLRALETTEGNKLKAAEILGLSRRQLYRKLEEFNIE
jgi:DNA-binding NtrC family response regulator